MTRSIGLNATSLVRNQMMSKRPQNCFPVLLWLKTTASKTGHSSCCRLALTAARAPISRDFIVLIWLAYCPEINKRPSVYWLMQARAGRRPSAALVLFHAAPCDPSLWTKFRFIAQSFTLQSGDTRHHTRAAGRSLGRHGCAAERTAAAANCGLEVQTLFIVL
jgi:hypothetical protein